MSIPFASLTRLRMPRQGGNPAPVFVLSTARDSVWYQAVAAEMNGLNTAFVVAGNAHPSESVAVFEPPPGSARAIGGPLRWLGRGRTLVVAELESDEAVRSLAPDPRASVPDTPATASATLPGGGYRPLAQAEHVAGGVLQPRASNRTELGDGVDRLRRLVLLERDPAGGQVADDSLDVIDLEVQDRLATGRGAHAGPSAAIPCRHRTGTLQGTLAADNVSDGTGSRFAPRRSSGLVGSPR